MGVPILLYVIGVPALSIGLLFCVGLALGAFTKKNDETAQNGIIAGLFYLLFAALAGFLLYLILFEAGSYW